MCAHTHSQAFLCSWSGVSYFQLRGIKVFTPPRLLQYVNERRESHYCTFSGHTRQRHCIYLITSPVKKCALKVLLTCPKSGSSPRSLLFFLRLPDLHAIKTQTKMAIIENINTLLMLRSWQKKPRLCIQRLYVWRLNQTRQEYWVYMSCSANVAPPFLSLMAYPPDLSSGYSICTLSVFYLSYVLCTFLRMWITFAPNRHMIRKAVILHMHMCCTFTTHAQSSAHSRATAQMPWHVSCFSFIFVETTTLWVFTVG